MSEKNKTPEVETGKPESEKKGKRDGTNLFDLFSKKWMRIKREKWLNKFPITGTKSPAFGLWLK